jgi:ABC-type multidrug transport system fused ATPase/permease subunit
MQSQPPLPSSAFNVAISVHESEYRRILTMMLADHELQFIVTDLDDPNDDSLVVQWGIAYVAVIGYEPGPIPKYKNPAGDFLTKLELDEAVQLNIPILLFVKENPVGGLFAFEEDSPRLDQWGNFRNQILRNFPSKSLPYSNVVIFKDKEDFRNKASYAIQQLRGYVLTHVRPLEEENDSNVVQTKTTGTRTKPGTKPRTWPPATQKVLERAQKLAAKTGRAGVTSSCILFALAEIDNGRKDTSSFIWKALDETGRYADEFERFFNDLGSAAGQTESEIEGLDVRASKNAKALLDNAEEIASRVTRSAQLSPRHILAALIAGGATDSIALRRFADMGVDLPKLSSDFLDFLRTRTDIPSDDFARWAAILTPKTFQHGPAGYNSEFVGMGGRRQLEDSLDVKDWAHQLADLIALRETKLPLAIGLFGNWGSGKSHFMNLMDQKLKSKTEEGKREGTSDRWCTEIVPVYFNAWHYLDSNLWASLVSQIFESLFTHLRPKTDELQKMQELLEEASGATARAAEEVKVAEGVTKQAREELVLAEQSRRTQETFVDGLLHGLKSLLPEVDQKTIQDNAAELLGVEKEIETIDDLRGVVNEGRSFTTRARAVAKKLWQQPWRLGFMAAAVVGAALIAYVLVPQIPWLKDQLEGTGRRFAALLGALAAFVTWVRPIFAEVGRRMSQLETWTSQAETAQQNARESETVKAATMRVDAAAAKEQDAQTRYQEARAREESLKAQALNLRPERRLGRFIEERSQSLDYRGQLGLISLARRDFQELSDIFADKEALDKRVAAAETNEDKALIETLSAAIDRIVLFVDDLDRCQPEKVVDVLQAVHLLLAFPLFAVIVGVDQRCLKQSLRMQMKGLLTDELSENGATPKPDPDADENGRPATPLDYLEKIFHVPFHLPQMGETGFKKLIDRLTEPVAATISRPREVTTPQEDKPPKPIVNKEPDIETNASEAQPDPQTHTDPAAGNGSRKTDPSDHTKQTHDGHAPPRDTESIIGSVPLQRWEREALRAYHPLIQTPRGATRLLNTYRLVRASVPKSEWEAFSGDKMSDGEFRIAMLLLAAAAGYPAQARQWFDRLLTTPAPELFGPNAPHGDDPPWIKFQEVYNATFGYLVKPIDADVMSKWIHRVERFAF